MQPPLTQVDVTIDPIPIQILDCFAFDDCAAGRGNCRSPRARWGVRHASLIRVIWERRTATHGRPSGVSQCKTSAVAVSVRRVDDDAHVWFVLDVPDEPALKAAAEQMEFAPFEGGWARKF